MKNQSFDWFFVFGRRQSGGGEAWLCRQRAFPVEEPVFFICTIQVLEMDKFLFIFI